MKAAILGISAYYHDSAAALLVDGVLVAAAQEKRFTRIRHDASFPIHACQYVLEDAGVAYDELSAVAFYEKSFLKFERLLETYHALAPHGLASFLAAMPVWINDKLFMRRMLDRELARLGAARHRILYPEHHLSHAASAFYPSPFAEAAILTVDGVGEWATTTIAHGRGQDIEIVSELSFPHSIGLLYSAFTYFAGFTVNSGEYKLMGLAPYGDPASARTAEFRRTITQELVDIRTDGSIVLNMANFEFARGLRMVDDGVWERLFGIPRRAPESAISQPYTDLALAIQEVTDEILVRLARTACVLTGSRRLVMAGGVALNCVANGHILRSRVADDLWIQPAAGDAGGAVGAAFATWHIHGARPRAEGRPACGDAMQGSYLGPEFSDQDVRRVVARHSAIGHRHDSVATLTSETARRLAAGQVGGWFQGRMEFGPRALGNRSILADPRQPEMQKRLNLKIKYREGFRPFAPAVREEDLAEYFDLDRPSPYMLLVAQVRKDRQIGPPPGYREMPLQQRLYVQRSNLPAVTHVDGSARIQTVSRTTNPRFWDLLAAFKRATGCGVLVNTSFNVRGEPIVCTPEDAFVCFMATEMDFLVIGDHLFDKSEQPVRDDQGAVRRTFAPD